MGRPREYRPPRRPEGWTTICLLDAPRDEVVLDETATPDGCLELVAYTAEGTVWVGIRPKGSSTNAAIGLHPGSEEHYVAATASIHSSWGVAFGAVSPEIAQVEVRNERGEVSPGRVIPLPPSFPEQYRAAWGVANCEEECRLVGRDDRDRLIDGAMVRPNRTDPAAEESLELIRKHCDSGLRYYTWALNGGPRSPSKRTMSLWWRAIEQCWRACSRMSKAPTASGPPCRCGKRSSGGTRRG